MTTRQVVVTGLGLVSAAGVGTENNWRYVVAAQPTAAVDPALTGCPVDLSCRVPGFAPATPAARRLDRFAQLAMAAATEAWTSAGLHTTPVDGLRCGTVLGTLAGGVGTFEAEHARLLESGPDDVATGMIPMAMASSATGAVSMRFGLRGTSLVVSTACASGTVAIGMALAMVRSGLLDIVLAGGAEAPLTPMTAVGYQRLGALSRRVTDPAGASRPFSASRDGFVLGEGAGILVLEAAEHASARRARQLAVVAGYGESADAFHPIRPHPQGDGIRRAMLAALRDAQMTPADVGHVNAHATSTVLGDAAEGRAIASVFGTRVAVSSTKGVTGHPLGAAGALEAGYTVLALRDQLAPPTANLDDPDPAIDLDLVSGRPRRLPLHAAISNSSGFGGTNASLVLTHA
ncbi:beta-ketoacyl-[acyl-carrier-protein] synthase family protein [Kitasatospora sp. NPDC058046]|uniref:beta-ketoacyl-[acyl-carrier-protein] synthase family protein n=1 Tax=Kitasatospora sp. NPDC058046 TaxID=3346312 RepID=UPI0036DF1E94